MIARLMPGGYKTPSIQTPTLRMANPDAQDGRVLAVAAPGRPGAGHRGGSGPSLSLASPVPLRLAPGLATWRHRDREKPVTCPARAARRRLTVTVAAGAAAVTVDGGAGCPSLSQGQGYHEHEHMNIARRPALSCEHHDCSLARSRSLPRRLTVTVTVTVTASSPSVDIARAQRPKTEAFDADSRACARFSTTFLVTWPLGPGRQFEGRRRTDSDCCTRAGARHCTGKSDRGRSADRSSTEAAAAARQPAGSLRGVIAGRPRRCRRR